MDRAGETKGNIAIVVKPYGKPIPMDALNALSHGPNIGLYAAAVGVCNSKRERIENKLILYLDTVQSDMDEQDALKKTIYGIEAIEEMIRTKKSPPPEIFKIPMDVREYYKHGENEWVKHSTTVIEDALKRANERLPPELKVHGIAVPHIGVIKRYKPDAGKKMKGEYARSLYSRKRWNALGFKTMNAEIYLPHAKKKIEGKFFVKML